MSTWKPNRINIHRTARAKGYQVVRPMVRDTLKGAKHLAPSGTRRHGSGTVDTRPDLANSFYTQWSETPRYITVQIGNRAQHAATVSQGSSAHDIRARSGPLLAFEWPRANFLRQHHRMSPRRLFFFRKVRHPGNKRPVRFLTTPLTMYGRRYNFKVTTVGVNRSRLP